MTDAGKENRLRGPLRQMIAVLEIERLSLAGLDLDGMLAAGAEKHTLCERIEQAGADLDAECVALLESARRLNEINRQVRNLIAANVSARLDALAGAPALYGKPAARAYATFRA